MLWDLWGCGTEQHLFYLCIFIIYCIVLVGVFFFPDTVILWFLDLHLHILFLNGILYIFSLQYIFLYGLLKCLVLQVSHFYSPLFFHFLFVLWGNCIIIPLSLFHDCLTTFQMLMVVYWVIRYLCYLYM